MEINVGSKAFFSNYKDFKPHDTDILRFVDNPEFKTNRQIHITNKMCIFEWRRMSKDKLLDIHLQLEDGMLVGKFLVPEVAAYLNLTMEDLVKLKPLIDKLDDKHKYEEIIYWAYLENENFILTDEQRLEAYNEYKKERGLL